jgi:hypothetical protein
MNNKDDDEKVVIHERKDTNKNGIPDDFEIYSCCSGSSDTRFIILLIQLFITICIVSLCVYKLADEPTCESSQLYNSLLSVIVGFWLKFKVNI